MVAKGGNTGVKGTLLREGRSGYTEPHVCSGGLFYRDPGIRQDMRDKRLSMTRQSSETEDPP